MADIDLNPKIGPDWTLPDKQRTVMTLGRKVMWYFAAAMDAVTDKLGRAKGEKKGNVLFIGLLGKLLKAYPDKKVIQVVLDNYCIK